ncbi:MAG TPA: hypothetical protein VN476_16710 [Pyrinomonadaceae bacterium]|nr:hypothetical protein [Pyrinomonadaceae bacterium]
MLASPALPKHSEQKGQRVTLIGISVHATQEIYQGFRLRLKIILSLEVLGSSHMRPISNPNDIRKFMLPLSIVPCWMLLRTTGPAPAGFSFFALPFFNRALNHPLSELFQILHFFSIFVVIVHLASSDKKK